MLLGPIFRAELLRTARRRRYFALRFLYGMLLLFVIWAAYVQTIGADVMVTIDQAAEFALDVFSLFAVVQALAILLLIPALFGGAIADEKQRKTLHYLMASRLSSLEIVVDKVLGRAPHVAVFLALGLPVVCLLGLVGGVPPEYVAVAYVGTASTATLAVALTVLVSTLARKVRQAVLISYILLIAWQLLPIILVGLGRGGIFPVAYSWIEPVNVWVGATSPLFVWMAAMSGMVGGRGAGMWSAYEEFAWMVGLQLGASACLIGLAVWQLRPAFRRHEATQPRRRWFEPSRARKSRAPRWSDRPGCGDDAMGWKERHFARTDVLTKLVVLSATVAVSVLLVLYVGLDETLLHAFDRLRRRGLNGWGVGDEFLVAHLRVVSAWYVAIWLLAVAGASASSVAVEREEDTWVSLTSTPLTGREILRGKALGAIWAQRGFAAVPLGFWAVGLLVGAVHPLGVAGAVLALAVVSWMVAAVGVHASLRATSTSKAITATIATLAILYGYPYLFYVLFANEGVSFRHYVTYLGFPPRLVVASLVSYREAGEAWSAGLSYLEVRWRRPGLGALAVYAAVATALTARCLLRFDRWLDRPAAAVDARSPRGPAVQSWGGKTSGSIW